MINLSFLVFICEALEQAVLIICDVFFYQRIFYWYSAFVKTNQNNKIYVFKLKLNLEISHLINTNDINYCPIFL